MQDLLQFIISNIVTQPDKVNIEEEIDNDITRYNVTLEDEDYPKIIGRRGMTIKAITDIVRLHKSKEEPDNFVRVYINARSIDDETPSHTSSKQNDEIEQDNASESDEDTLSLTDLEELGD